MIEKLQKLSIKHQRHSSNASFTLHSNSSPALAFLSFNFSKGDRNLYFFRFLLCVSLSSVSSHRDFCSQESVAARWVRGSERERDEKRYANDRRFVKEFPNDISTATSSSVCIFDRGIFLHSFPLSHSLHIRGNAIFKQQKAKNVGHFFLFGPPVNLLFFLLFILAFVGAPREPTFWAVSRNGIY